MLTADEALQISQSHSLQLAMEKCLAEAIYQAATRGQTSVLHTFDNAPMRDVLVVAATLHDLGYLVQVEETIDGYSHNITFHITW